jgi:hypothetical protein
MSLSPSVMNNQHSDLWVSRMADIAITPIYSQKERHMQTGRSECAVIDSTKKSVTIFFHDLVEYLLVFLG